MNQYNKKCPAKKSLSDILFFVYKRNGVAGYHAGSFGSQTAVAQGDGLIMVLNGFLNFLRTKIAFRTDKYHSIRRFLINLLEQLLVLLVTMSDKFFGSSRLLNKFIERTNRVQYREISFQLLFGC